MQAMWFPHLRVFGRKENVMSWTNFFRCDWCSTKSEDNPSRQLFDLKDSWREIDGEQLCPECVKTRQAGIDAMREARKQGINCIPKPAESTPIQLNTDTFHAIPPRRDDDE